MTAVFLAPLVIFMAVVAPLWLILHYRSKHRISEGLSEGDKVQIDALSERANSLQQRIVTLEDILDQQAPGWRDNNV